MSKFKENVIERLNQVESSLHEHEQVDIKNNISERLARIETDIQWIRQALVEKK
jgi:hypothetical protein